MNLKQHRLGTGELKMIDLKGFEIYLREEELAENTIDSYMATMKQFASRYDIINKNNVLEFKQSFIKFKPKTVNVKISAVEKYCNFVGIPIKIKRVKCQKISHVENVINQEQYNKLLSCLKAENNTRWLVNILVLAKTGARVSEAVKLTKGDALRGFADISTKGKTRRIYIPKSLINDISEFIEPLGESETIMRGRFGSITPRGVSQQLYNFSRRFNIPCEVMHAHSFRHFFAINFLSRNNDIALLADLLGHSGVNTTMIYLRKSAEQQRYEIDEAVNW